MNEEQEPINQSSEGRPSLGVCPYFSRVQDDEDEEEVHDTEPTASPVEDNADDYPDEATPSEFIHPREYGTSRHLSQSRVSTNDSNELHEDTEEFPDLTQRNLRFEDLESRSFDYRHHMPYAGGVRDQFNLPRNEELAHYYLSQWIKDSYISCFSWTKTCLIKLLSFLTFFFYHAFTTLLFLTEALLLVSLLLLFYVGAIQFDSAIWLFVALTILFVILRVVLTNIFPESALTLGISGYGQSQQTTDVLSRRSHRHSSSERHSSRRRRSGSPQSSNQRRLAREYSRNRYSGAIDLQSDPQMPRRHPPIPSEIELADIQNSQAPPSLQHLFPLAMPASLSRSSSSRRSMPQLRFAYGNTVSLEEMRRRRETVLRNEILRRILNRVGSSMERQRNIQNQLMLLGANLQMLHLQSLGREFNENDYDVLSQLDSYHTRQATEKIQMIVSQLPTYIYRDKDESAKCEKDFNTHSCSICIEPFVEDESIKILPCFHQFHTQCVDDWLLRKTLCPVCKFDIEYQFNNEEQIMAQQQHQQQNAGENIQV